MNGSPPLLQHPGLHPQSTTEAIDLLRPAARANDLRGMKYLLDFMMPTRADLTKDPTEDGVKPLEEFLYNTVHGVFEKAVEQGARDQVILMLPYIGHALTLDRALATAADQSSSETPDGTPIDHLAMVALLMQHANPQHNHSQALRYACDHEDPTVAQLLLPVSDPIAAFLYEAERARFNKCESLAPWVSPVEWRIMAAQHDKTTCPRIHVLLEAHELATTVLAPSLDRTRARL